MAFDIKNIIPNTKRKSILVVNGYQAQLTIIFGYQKISNETFLLWKVDGTDKTFGIEIGYVTRDYGSNYDNYFIELLEQFRDDFLNWKKQDDELFYKYRSFDRIILPFTFKAN